MFHLSAHPTWQVVGTQANVYPTFGVPGVGGNGVVCTGDERDPASPVGFGKCSISHGYDPSATVEFVDVAPRG